jgi:hypothetical protein
LELESPPDAADAVLVTWENTRDFFHYHHSTPKALYRRELCRAMGPWADIGMGQDLEYTLRLYVCRVPQLLTPDPLVFFRLHDNGRISGFSRDPAKVRKRLGHVPALARLLESHDAMKDADGDTLGLIYLSEGRSAARASMMQEARKAVQEARKYVKSRGAKAKVTWVSLCLHVLPTGAAFRLVDSLYEGMARARRLTEGRSDTNV